MIDLPKLCYPDLVTEFYANLHMKGDNHLSEVKKRKICLNTSIIEFEYDSEINVFTKRGILELEGMSESEHLKIVK